MISCPVLSWKADSVSCLLSPGVAGAVYAFVVAQAGPFSGSFVRSSAATLTFVRPFITGVTPLELDPAGGVVVLTGTNFPISLDSSLWKGTVHASPVSGGGLIGGSSQDVDPDFDGNNLTAAWFTMPSFEGRVTLKIRLSSPGALVESLNDVALVAVAPTSE